MSADYYITGYVYFVQEGDDGPVKIASTIELEQRLLALQSSNHHRLRLLGAIDLRKAGVAESSDRVEFSKLAREKKNEIHQRFATERRRGDWFNLSSSLASFIEEVSNVRAAV